MNISRQYYKIIPLKMPKAALNLSQLVEKTFGYFNGVQSSILDILDDGRKSFGNPSSIFFLFLCFDMKEELPKLLKDEDPLHGIVFLAQKLNNYFDKNNDEPSLKTLPHLDLKEDSKIYDVLSAYNKNDRSQIRFKLTYNMINTFFTMDYLSPKPEFKELAENFFTKLDRELASFVPLGAIYAPLVNLILAYYERTGKFNNPDFAKESPLLAALLKPENLYSQYLGYKNAQIVGFILLHVIKYLQSARHPDIFEELKPVIKKILKEEIIKLYSISTDSKPTESADSRMYYMTLMLYFLLFPKDSELFDSIPLDNLISHVERTVGVIQKRSKFKHSSEIATSALSRQWETFSHIRDILNPHNELSFSLIREANKASDEYEVSSTMLIAQELLIILNTWKLEGQVQSDKNYGAHLFQSMEAFQLSIKQSGMTSGLRGVDEIHFFNRFKKDEYGPSDISLNPIGFLNLLTLSYENNPEILVTILNDGYELLGNDEFTEYINNRFINSSSMTLMSVSRLSSITLMIASEEINPNVKRILLEKIKGISNPKLLKSLPELLEYAIYILESNLSNSDFIAFQNELISDISLNIQLTVEELSLLVKFLQKGSLSVANRNAALHVLSVHMMGSGQDILEYNQPLLHSMFEYMSGVYSQEEMLSIVDSTILHATKVTELGYTKLIGLCGLCFSNKIPIYLRAAIAKKLLSFYPHSFILRYILILNSDEQYSIKTINYLLAGRDKEFKDMHDLEQIILMHFFQEVNPKVIDNNLRKIRTNLNNQKTEITAVLAKKAELVKQAERELARLEAEEMAKQAAVEVANKAAEIARKEAIAKTDLKMQSIAFALNPPSVLEKDLFLLQNLETPDVAGIKELRTKLIEEYDMRVMTLFQFLEVNKDTLIESESDLSWYKENLNASSEDRIVYLLNQKIEKYESRGNFIKKEEELVERKIQTALIKANAEAAQRRRKQSEAAASAATAKRLEAVQQGKEAREKKNKAMEEMAEGISFKTYKTKSTSGMQGKLAELKRIFSRVSGTVANLEFSLEDIADLPISKNLNEYIKQVSVGKTNGTIHIFFEVLGEKIEGQLDANGTLTLFDIDTQAIGKEILDGLNALIIRSILNQEKDRFFKTLNNGKVLKILNEDELFEIAELYLDNPAFREKYQIGTRPENILSDDDQISELLLTRGYFERISKGDHSVLIPISQEELTERINSGDKASLVYFKVIPMHLRGLVPPAKPSKGKIEEYIREEISPDVDEVVFEIQSGSRKDEYLVADETHDQGVSFRKAPYLVFIAENDLICDHIKKNSHLDTEEDVKTWIERFKTGEEKDSDLRLAPDTELGVTFNKSITNTLNRDRLKKSSESRWQTVVKKHLQLVVIQ